MHKHQVAINSGFETSLIYYEKPKERRVILMAMLMPILMFDALSTETKSFTLTEKCRFLTINVSKNCYLYKTLLHRFI